MTFLLQGPASKTHGTRACYVGGCRCVPCTKSNVRAYHERQRAINDQAATVHPSGPPIPGTLIRAGKVYNVLRCPGGNGRKCVVRGGAWLRGAEVCRACVERATVWNGMVSTNKALAHLKKLSDAGVGYKSVASACSVGHTTLLKIITGRVKRIRVSTEREILSVDEDALADGALVPAGPTNELLKQLLQLGFRKRELARHLGVETPRLQLGTRDRVQLHTAAKVEKLVRQLARGEVVPKAWCTPGEAQELVRREIDIPRPDGPLSAVDAFLHELRELRELRRLSPKNMNKQPGEAMINLANFKETT